MTPKDLLFITLLANEITTYHKWCDRTGTEFTISSVHSAVERAYGDVSRLEAEMDSIIDGWEKFKLADYIKDLKTRWDKK